jgi:hypothetical protein
MTLNTILNSGTVLKDLVLLWSIWFFCHHIAHLQKILFYKHFPANTEILTILKCLVQLLGILWQKYRSVLAWLAACIFQHIKQYIDLFHEVHLIYILIPIQMKNTVRVSVCSTRTHIIFLACKGGVKHPWSY